MMAGWRIKRSHGFTLIELMIVLVVIAILATIALPSYQAFVRRGHQAAAQEFMLAVASRAQQFRLDTRSYPTGLGANAGELDMTAPANVGDYYDVRLKRIDPPPGFKLTATPKSGTPQAGEATLVLNNKGDKMPPEAWQ